MQNKTEPLFPDCLTPPVLKLVLSCLQRPVCCVCTCSQLWIVWRHTEEIGISGPGWGGLPTVYQYSKRTLSETTSSPLRPSAHQSLLMEAEHASFHLVSSLPPSAFFQFLKKHFLFPFFPRIDTSGKGHWRRLI